MRFFQQKHMVIWQKNYIYLTFECSVLTKAFLGEGLQLPCAVDSGTRTRWQPTCLVSGVLCLSADPRSESFFSLPTCPLLILSTSSPLLQLLSSDNCFPPGPCSSPAYYSGLRRQPADNL